MAPGRPRRRKSGRRASAAGRERPKTRCMRGSGVVEGKHPTGERETDGWLQSWPRPVKVLWAVPDRAFFFFCAVGEYLGCLPVSSTVCLLAGCDLLGGIRALESTKSHMGCPDRLSLGQAGRLGAKTMSRVSHEDELKTGSLRLTGGDAMAPVSLYSADTARQCTA